MPPNAAFTIVVAIPKGAVPPPKPILEERFNLGTAFSITPVTAGVGGALLALVLVVFLFLQYRFGSDRRYRGSAVDQAFGSEGGADERVPGQLGTLVDFTANPLDVTATIVDLAVRGYLVIEEIPGEEGFLHKPDWKLTKKKEPGPELKEYEQKLLGALFEDGNDVQLSDLKYTFAARMNEVQKALTDDAMAQGWFVRLPSIARMQWGCLGVLLLLIGVGVMTLLIVFTHAALLGIPLIVGGILVTFGAYWMPQRTAKGTCCAGPKVSAGSSTSRRRSAPGSQSRRTCSPSTCPTRSSSARRVSGLPRSPVSTISRPTRRRGTCRRRRSRSSRFPAPSTVSPSRRPGRSRRRPRRRRVRAASPAAASRAAGPAVGAAAAGDRQSLTPTGCPSTIWSRYSESPNPTFPSQCHSVMPSEMRVSSMSPSGVWRRFRNGMSESTLPVIS